MRMVLAAAAALAVFTVAGCDINTGAPKAAKVECNCTPPQAAAPGPVADEPVPHRHHWRHRSGAGHAYGGHSYAWRREYSEVSVSTYDYHSASSSYVADGSSSSASTGSAVHGDEHGWTDGYGRSHGGDTAEIAGDDRVRLHPWHGYDADCPDNDTHRRR